ncbi:MAG: cob(I)yrinic acid a,c-diamide adenosyltransferase [Deltaproteobacteria bacterium]|nr:cob(I)yrinic acid a,c-diamide adenosyltransferase [Deltaproteobacteria bacterium]
MKLYTRRGDGGETGLFAPGRVRKDALRVEAYGALDELNAVLGVAAAQCRRESRHAEVEAQAAAFAEAPQSEREEAQQRGVALAELADLCQRLQGEIFDLGSYLAAPDAGLRAKGGVPEPRDEDIAALERHIDGFEAELTPLRRFILPGGTQSAAALHLARTVCRRAERRCVSLHSAEPLHPAALGYLNRLSDLLFAMARAANRRNGTADREWTPRR